MTLYKHTKGDAMMKKLNYVITCEKATKNRNFDAVVIREKDSGELNAMFPIIKEETGVLETVNMAFLRYLQHLVNDFDANISWSIYSDVLNRTDN